MNIFVLVLFGLSGSITPATISKSKETCIAMAAAYNLEPTKDGRLWKCVEFIEVEPPEGRE